MSIVNIDTPIASAYSVSRNVVAAINELVLPNLECPGLECLRARIDSRDIFDEGMIVELENLIDTLSREVADETTAIKRFGNDPCNVSHQSWTERYQTQRGNELNRALIAVQDLLENLYAVHDLMYTARELEKLRQRN